MALTLPAYGFSAIDLGPDLGMAGLSSEAGLYITSRRGDPMLTGKLTTRQLQPAQFADYEAFLIGAMDQNQRLDIVNPRFRLPRAYTDATWPLVSDPTLAADPTDLRSIAVAGLSIGMTLKRGDRLCLIQGTGDDQLVCYRWLSADVTVASIVSQALSIAPRLPIGIFAEAATVRFKDPFCRVAIVPGTLTNAISDDTLTTLAFEVEEALR